MNLVTVLATTTVETDMQAGVVHAGGSVATPVGVAPAGHSSSPICFWQLQLPVLLAQHQPGQSPLWWWPLGEEETSEF